VSGGASVAQLVGLFLFIGWLAALLLHRTGDRAARDILASNPWLIVLLTLFMAWVAMSLLWAEDTHRALLFLLYFAFVAAIFPVVHAGIRTTRHVVLLYTMLIGTALVAGMFASRSPSPAAGERLEGAGFNPNLLGLYLLVACVLGATLACNGNLSAPARILAGVGATLAPVFFVLTASRGAFVGFIAAAAFAPLVARPGRRLVTLLAILAIAVGGAAAATAFAPETAVNRLTHWDKTGSGRSDLWTIGMRMVNDKPVIGVGAGNFEVASIHYLLEPGAILRDEYIIDSPKETHNMYLEILSELGIVGLTLFLAALGYCLACLLRAIRLARAYGQSELELLSRGLLLALMSLLTAMFFSSQTFNKELYLLLATCLALLAIARRAATAAERAR
jgi:O-antigen ligase